jgi:DNA-binding SARP family transcriptional activator/predicted ATPase
MKLYLLGTPRLEIAGKPASLGRRKSMALLAYLALTGQPHGRPALAALFWPESEPQAAFTSLRQALAPLKKLLGEDCLEISPSVVGIRPQSPLWVDALAFENCLQGAPDMAALRQAAALYQAAFMDGFTIAAAPDFDAWQRAQTERFRFLWAQLLAQLTPGLVQLGEFEAALSYARRLAALEPLHEAAQTAVVHLLAKTGQPTAAQDHYQQFAQRLRQETGQQPTLTMAQALAGASPNATGDNMRSATPVRHAAPPCSLTPIIGRDEEIGQLTALLAEPDCRLVTLHGPGGVGKTRLAWAAAGEFGAPWNGPPINAPPFNAPPFSGAVYFVPLLNAAADDGLAQAIAHALRLKLDSSRCPWEQILDQLTNRRALLLLDNFDHLTAAAHRLTQILTAAPGVKLLVTSRCRLNLYEEWLLPLSGLAYPAAADDPDPMAYSGVQLFARRARQTRPDYELTAGDLRHAVQLCQAVNGLPLAIELAAAWIRKMTCAEIAAAVQDNPVTLSAAWTNSPPQHKSFAAVNAYSWQLLSPAEQRAAGRLALFSAGFDATAALATASANEAILTALGDQSLIARLGDGRFAMHEIMRQYALAQLAANPAGLELGWRDYGAYFADFLAERDEQLQDGRQQAAVYAINAELDNIHAFWRQAASRGWYTQLDRALPALYLFYEITGYFHEGLRQFELAARAWLSGPAPADLSPEVRQTIGRLQIRQGLLLLYLRRLDQAEESLQAGRRNLAAVTGAKWAQDEILALTGLGSVALRREARQEARRWLEQALALAQQEDDLGAAARIISRLGIVAGAADLAEARRFHETSLSLYEEMGNPFGVAISLNNLSHIVELEGDYDQAQILLQKSLAICLELPSRWLALIVLANLTNIAQLKGNEAEADYYRQERAALAARSDLSVHDCKPNANAA